MRRERPDVVVNCAADNDVDGAETEPLRALAVNAFAVRALARAADECGAALVHYSTDFVFDGTASRPYVETDEPNPQGVYAASKLLGEWFALEARRGFVLRVESLFGARRSGAALRAAASTGSSRASRPDGKSPCSPTGRCRPATSSISPPRRARSSKSTPPQACITA